MTIPGLIMIGDRINPGFKSVRKMLDEGDFEGLQALAVRQVEAGSEYLDITIGPRGADEPELLTKVVNAVQEAVDVPLCFDYTETDIQAVCLKAYDPAKANGRRPLINSLAETRLQMLDLLEIQPFKAVVMTSEYLEDGKAKSTRTAEEVVSVAKRMRQLLMHKHDFQADDIFIDIIICSIASDTDGRVKMGFDAIELIGQDPEFQGSHLMGGLTNVGNMLPPIKIDGIPLRHKIESAYLSVAVPLGFDAVMATPWNHLEILPEDDEVLQTFKETIELRGVDAMRRLRQIWAKK